MKDNHWLGSVLLLAVGCGRASGAERLGHQGVLEFDEREVSFEVGGRLREVSVRRGQEVAPGAPIAALDDSLARPMREARAAEVEAARARVALLRAGARPSELRTLEAQIAGARAAEAAVERNLRRARGLAEQGAAPSAQVDDLNGQYERARAERSSLEERLHTMRQGARPQEIAAAQAQALAATQALAAEDQRLSRFSTRALVAGTVVDVLVDPGDVVAPGAPVAIVADTSHPYVDVFVPQGRIGAVRVGARATVRVDASREPFRGVVEDVGRETEFAPRFLFSERERPTLVLRVRVRVEDPQRALRAGVPAFAEIAGAR